MPLASRTRSTTFDLLAQVQSFCTRPLAWRYLCNVVTRNSQTESPLETILIVVSVANRLRCVVHSISSLDDGDPVLPESRSDSRYGGISSPPRAIGRKETTLSRRWFTTRSTSAAEYWKHPSAQSRALTQHATVLFALRLEGFAQSLKSGVPRQPLTSNCMNAADCSVACRRRSPVMRFLLKHVQRKP
jgi:hypothetical protein